MAQAEGRKAIYQALGSRCYNLEAMAVTRSQYHFESVDDETAAIMRAKTPAERLQIAGGMWRFARGSGLQIDAILGKGTPLDRSRFAGCRRIPIGPDAEAAFASPEDVILKRLEFYRNGGSEKHLRDVAGILKISGESLDRVHVAEWARNLGVEDIWETLTGRQA